MADNTESIVLDEDIEELSNFRHQALTEIFGKDVADQLANPDDGDDEFFDENADEFAE